MGICIIGRLYAFKTTNVGASVNKTKNFHRDKHVDKSITFFVGDGSKDLWVVHSGSSTHISNGKNKFQDFIYHSSNVTIANGQELHSVGSGP